MRILVAEDDEALGGFVRRGLETEHYTVDVSNDGEQARSLIPSLLVSMAGGMVVTRASSDSTLSVDLRSQLLSRRRTLFIAAGVMLALAAIPGLPKFSFLLLAAAVAVLAWRTPRERAEGTAAAPTEAAAKPKLESVEDLLKLDELSLEVGYALVPLVDQQQGGQLLARVRALADAAQQAKIRDFTDKKDWTGLLKWLETVAAAAVVTEFSARAWPPVLTINAGGNYPALTIDDLVRGTPKWKSLEVTAAEIAAKAEADRAAAEELIPARRSHSMISRSPTYYRHITAVNPRFRSRNFRQEDGVFAWNEMMQSWLDEPRVYVHRRRSLSLMSALGGRKESDGN